ncbi:substrate-binding domain-containing protein [Oceanobacillus sp. Castelsardo]|uniref:substrate-binding domain-containing protein n=1 Tax=Oceanobacillus sp. Castelsardo TaxID=1851204 RepID=UPI0008390F6E|nr:substrate-binding domain-containing protein [Oceanobacillus sp. Castelsardo]
MNWKKKYWLNFSIILLLIVLISGCSTSKDASTEEQANQSDKLVIGVAHANYEDTFLNMVLDGVKEFVDEHSNEMKADYIDAGNDSNKQIDQAEQFIEQGVDAIMLIPVDVIAAELILEKAERADIPIVLINRSSLETESVFIGSDDVSFGVMQMERIAQMLKGKGNIAIMNGPMGQESQINRTKGNKQVMEEHKGMKVVLEGTANWSQDEAKSLMKTWIESGIKIDAVVANNDEMAIGAIKAAEEAGIRDEIIFAGIDGTPDGLQYIKSNKLAVSVLQNAKEQGQTGMSTALRMAKGETVPKESIYIPAELIVKENVDKFR